MLHASIAFALALALTPVLVACQAPATPRLVAPELATPAPLPRTSGDRAPSHTACVGHSDDPPSAVLDAAIAQAGPGSATAYAALLAFAVEWPHSATVRVRAADAAREPEDSLRLYADAVRLHDEKCALAPNELHTALHGLGAARLSAGDLPGARAAFARAVAAFPDASPSRYAYAATLCRLREHDACVTELRTALGAAPELRELAARDPDFEAVRSDARLALIRP